MSRLSKRLKKFAKKAAPIAAIAGLGFLMGPAGVGVGQRILGGLGRVAKTGAKLAAPVVESLARGQEQQSAASPQFDQQDAATPPQFRQAVYGGRLRPRFERTLGPSAGAFSEEEPSMSLLSSVKGVLPGAGQLVKTALRTKLSKQLPQLLSTPVPFATRIPSASALGFHTGGTMETYGMRRRSKRINPTNVKALRRALRRVEGFVKIEKRVDALLRHAAPRARQARKSGFVKSPMR